MTSDPDHFILDKIIAGDQQAYAGLVDKYKGYAFTIAHKILQNKGEAEEAAQDAFIKVYHHLAGFSRQSKFSTWLYRIVFNTAVSYKRKHKQQFHDIENMVIVHNQEAESVLEKTDQKKYLQQALTKLNEADQTALTLFYLKEHSLEEIAEITGMPANTVKVRIHRARLRLAEELKTLLKCEAIIL